MHVVHRDCGVHYYRNGRPGGNSEEKSVVWAEGKHRRVIRKLVIPGSLRREVALRKRNDMW